MGWAVKSMGKVSVVVSVYSEDRLGYLLGCVDSVRRQSAEPYEVIVVLPPLTLDISFLML